MALTAKKVYAILKRQISDMEAKLNSPVRYRGTVATVDLLPLNPDIGDMYNIESKSVYGEAGMNVAWNGVAWDTMGAPIDMSLYFTKEEADTTIQNMVNEYLEKNPVKPGATTEQAQQIEQNKTNIASLKEDLSEVADKHESKNLYNKDAFGVEVDKYTYYNGKTEVDTNYLTTDFMRVEVGKIITFYAYAPNESNENKRTIGQIIACDSDKNVLADKGGMNVSSLQIQDGVAYVRLCFRKNWENVMVQMSDDGSQAVYEPYFEPYFTVKGVEDIKQKVESLDVRLDNQNKLNHVETTSDFLSDFKQSLAKNVVVSYVANFDTFNSLKIGYTSKDEYLASGGFTDYFEITTTQFIMHREDLDDVAWDHGLSIDKFIGVELSFDITKRYTAKITTISGTFEKSNNIYLGRTYYPFAVIDGTNVKNNNLSVTCKDLRKNIFAFGDSYFSNSSARWMYYLENKDSICINQYAGESSESAIIDFRTLIKYGNPKFVLWCLGMNDKTDADENTPSKYWLPYITEIIETCKRNNIVPVLTTIPSVPNISHKGKNKWIRESGYHYIDFAKAVEFDDNGHWYNGLLSSDNVHPTDEGAKILYLKAITDFPDLLVIN